MSIKKIHLRKLLQLLYADNRLRRKLLLEDIRNDGKSAGAGDGARDFYGPFWADAKAHAAGTADITAQTEMRIQSNKERARLYPILRDSFLWMLNEKMRWRNEPFLFMPESVKAQLPIEELGAIIKIENTAAVETWDGSHRVIYPYFSEVPELPEEGARLGLWALSAALKNYRPEEFRIVDFHRRAYLSPEDVGLTGTEREKVVVKYGQLLADWQKLRKEKDK